jgi:hypothetical protein
MRLSRTLRIAIAVLFACMLSLEGAAALPGCARCAAPHSVAPQAPEQHCAHGSGAMQPHSSGATQSHASGATHQPGCGAQCCGAGIASTPVLWSMPRGAAAGFALPMIWPLPDLQLYRLDRPPRSL